MINYPNTYIANYMTGKSPIEEAYAECSSELMRLRLAQNRNTPYIESLEFQERYLSCIVIRNYMKDKGYAINDTDPYDVHWEKNTPDNN